MIQVFDNVITNEFAGLNKDLISNVCENHANLEDRSPSWVGFGESSTNDFSQHSKEDQIVIDEYLTKIIKPLSLSFLKTSSIALPIFL